MTNTATKITTSYFVKIGYIEKPLYGISFSQANNYAHCVAKLHNIDEDKIDIIPLQNTGRA